MREHRGVRVSTVAVYVPVVVALLDAIDGDIERLTARRIRAFVVERAGRHGHQRASSIVTATRVFLRYLVASGQCDATQVAALLGVDAKRALGRDPVLHALRRVAGAVAHRAEP